MKINERLANCFRVSAVRELINNTDHKCQGEETIAGEAKNQDDANIRFAILETHVKTNICLRSFTWLQWPSKEFPAANHPRSALILNGTNVDVGLIVTFQPEDTANLEVQKRRKLEAKGLTAGSLIFQFSESSSYVTDLDGLKFGRIHNNLADCEFKSELPTGKFNLSGSWDRPVPPSVEQVDLANTEQKCGLFYAAVRRVCRGVRENWRRRNAFTRRARNSGTDGQNQRLVEDMVADFISCNVSRTYSNRFSMGTLDSC